MLGNKTYRFVNTVQALPTEANKSVTITLADDLPTSDTPVRWVLMPQDVDEEVGV